MKGTAAATTVTLVAVTAAVGGGPGQRGEGAGPCWASSLARQHVEGTRQNPLRAGGLLKTSGWPLAGQAAWERQPLQQQAQGTATDGALPHGRPDT